jgi:nucleotide-binding universal stress UspA family protein
MLTRIRVASHGLQREAIVVEETETGESLRGMAWSGGELWSSTGDELVRIDPASGHPIERVSLPGPTGVRDFAADPHGRFWCVDGTSGRVRVFARPGWVEAMGEPATHPLAQAPLSSRVLDASASGPAQPGEKPSLQEALSSAASTFDRILVPVDFSQSVKRALGMAFLLEERFQSEVHLVHLAEQGANAEFLAGAGALVGYGDIAQDARRQVLQFVEDLFPGRGSHVKVHVHVAHDLVPVIRHVSRAIDATLVVLTEGPHHVLSTSKVDKIAHDLKQERAVMVVPANRPSPSSSRGGASGSSARR